MGHSPRCSDDDALSFLIHLCHPLSVALSGETLARTLLARRVVPHSNSAVMVLSVKDMVSVCVED